VLSSQEPIIREWVCVNGTLVPAEQATISAFDSGLLQGIGLFETMRAYMGRTFRLDQHVDRLIASAVALGWTRVPDADELRDHVERVVGAVEQAEARVRLTVTTGSLRAGASDEPQLTIIASASPGGTYPLDLYRHGVTALISRYRHNPDDPIVCHKTTSYFARLASLREAHAAGAFESLWFTHDDVLAEGSISSVFIVRDDQLLTPPLDTPILPGITRAAVIEIAVEEGIPVREAEIDRRQLLDADEVFLTSSLVELMPVVRVGREPIGEEKPGELTLGLWESYRRRIKAECVRGGSAE